MERMQGVGSAVARWRIVRRLWGLGAAGLLVALNLHCGKTSRNPGAAGDSSETSGGTGGAVASSVVGDLGAATTMSTGGSRSDAGGGAAIGGASSEGTTGAAGAAGAGMAVGTATCSDFPNDSHQDHCEPTLRAVRSSREDIRLLTFQYDSGGRLVTVGDERSHNAYFAYRYSYDEQARLSRYEADCDPDQAAGQCSTVYDFIYSEDGWLETMEYTYDALSRQRVHRQVYDEAGRLQETLEIGPQGTTGWLYRYRDDGQVEARVAFTIDENGERQEGSVGQYEYGDDDLLDRIVYNEEDYDWIDYNHVVENGRVRVSSLQDADAEYFEAVIFDDVGRRAFGYSNVQGDDPGVFAFLGGARTFYAWGDWAMLEARYPIEPPHHMFPYSPYDWTREDVEDFNYEYRDLSFSRRCVFSEEGLLEQVQLSWGAEYSVGIEVLRCDGVLLEITDLPNPSPEHEVTVYYYGCGDFVLPAAPEGL